MPAPHKHPLITTRHDRPDLDLGDYTAAGHILWAALAAAHITPNIEQTSAGRAIHIDLPNDTTVWITEDADISHLPTDHESWSALHFYDPTDSGNYVQVYLGPGGLTCEADTAACVSTIKAWIANYTTTGAVARHNTHLTLLRTSADPDAIRGSWRISYGQPGFDPTNPVHPTERHTATVIDRVITQPDRRGACLACNWEGPPRRDQNKAVEDALDHSHPGWRDLPTIPRGTGGKNVQRLRAYLDTTYPPDWFETGGPLKVFTTTANDRHEPGAARGGGYLVKVHRPSPAAGPQHEQQSLI
ncbi:DUF6349 family protein [Kitasatospora purpeofusca]|uniref:DUF6349 family protein n=1 Tax=Kitasatospora purpeofusca TaxID=67352 RepID=UPI0037FB2D3F